jgi:hypothetical protein
MYKKFTVLVLLAASSVLFLPTQSAAFSAVEKTSTVTEYSANNSAAPQIRIRIGSQRRNRNRRWNNRRWNNNRQTRVVRQVYYRNGRRYVRTVRY